MNTLHYFILSFIGFFLIYLGVSGIKSGVIHEKRRRCYREKNPLAFWFMIGMQLTCGILMLLFGLTKLIYYLKGH